MKQKSHKTALHKIDNKIHNMQTFTVSSGSNSQLSQREVQMLELVSDGLDSQTIAGQLFISTNTVQTHRKTIIKKMQAINMIHAVAKAFKCKILS